MTIRFQCPNDHTLQVQEELAGKRGTCPECGAKVQVPLPKAGVASKAADASSGTAANPAQRPPQTATPAAEPPSAPPVAKPVAKAVAKPKPTSPPASPTTGQWHLRTATGEQYGPATDDQFRQWITDHRVAPDSYVWREGWPDWRQAAEVAEALPAPLPIVPALPQVSRTSGAEQPSAATRYAARRKRANRTRLLAAIALLVLTLALGGVLASILLSDPATESEPVEVPLPADIEPPPDEPEEDGEENGDDPEIDQDDPMKDAAEEE